MRKTLAAKVVCTAVLLVFCASACALAQNTLPPTTVVALDDHEVQLPRDLANVNVFIIGFSRASADATTAWEIPVRTHVANNRIGFYDVAVLASVPSFFRGWINRSLKKKVPPVLQPRFLPIYADEAGWKAFAGFDKQSSDSAYIVVTDRAGKTLWTTHEPYSTDSFARLISHTEM